MTAQDWPIKDLLYGKNTFSWGTQQVIPPKQAKNDAKYCLHDGILKFGLLTKHEVKLAEYWLIFVCVLCVDRDRISIHKNSTKGRGQYPAIQSQCKIWFILPPHRASLLIKGHIACSGSQSQCKIWFILPPYGASLLIKGHITCSGSQSQCRISFILPTHGASHNKIQ